VRVGKDETLLTRKILLVLEKEAAGFDSREVRCLPRLMIISGLFCREYAEHLGLDPRHRRLSKSGTSQHDTHE
jgi:hypothetical protein